jgi:hypothetical protein
VSAGDDRALRLAAIAGLLALALVVWSLLDPRVLPLMVAMSAGQALGAGSLGLFLFVVIRDARRARLLHHEDERAAAGRPEDAPK